MRSRLTKIAYHIIDYQAHDRLTDKQIIKTTIKNLKKRIIYQCRKKRTKLDRQNIAKQINKAKRIISGQKSVSKNKFLKLTAKTKRLNQKLIAKAYALAGIKGYATNLDILKQSLTITISYLKSRPISSWPNPIPVPNPFSTANAIQLKLI